MTYASSQRWCMLIAACFFSAAVIVGSFTDLPWSRLIILSWLALSLFGKRSALALAAVAIKSWVTAPKR